MLDIGDELGALEASCSAHCSSLVLGHAGNLVFSDGEIGDDTPWPVCNAVHLLKVRDKILASFRGPILKMSQYGGP